MVLGVISPKMSTTRVSTPVAILTPQSCHNLKANVVVKAEAERFTILLPIRIALSILGESSIIFNTMSALLSPSSDRLRSLMELTMVSAVSADEKKADKAIKIIININCIKESVSNN